MASFPEAKALVPGLRMIVVAGPRIDPATLPAADGLEVRAFVDDLYKHLAACDLAVVQGGLTTAMELTANGRPFLYFPLKHHFEQTIHVRHRLERHGAGRRMDFEAAPPPVIAARDRGGDRPRGRLPPGARGRRGPRGGDAGRAALSPGPPFGRTGGGSASIRLRSPFQAMDGAEHRTGNAAGPDPEPLLIAPAAILEGLPDAVVAMAVDGRIVYVNALAEELFGYARDELVGRSVEMLWAKRMRERYMRNLLLYFETKHPLRFTAEAWGVRRDGTEFIGEMSWGIVATGAGPLLLAIGRDVSEQRAAEARLRALAAMGERALAGAEPNELAAEAVQLIRGRLPVTGAEVRLADGSSLARAGEPGDGLHLQIGTGDQLVVAPARELTDEEMSIVRAVANTLAVALARLRDEAQMRHEAVHDPLTGLANRTLLRDRLEQVHARSLREGGDTGVLFVDLDDFKQINDAHGHGTGDAVLVEFATRLRHAVRPGGHRRARRRRRVRRRLRPPRRRGGARPRRAAPGGDPAAGRRRRRRAPDHGEHRDRGRPGSVRAARGGRRGRLPREGRGRRAGRGRAPRLSGAAPLDRRERAGLRSARSGSPHVPRPGVAGCHAASRRA